MQELALHLRAQFGYLVEKQGALVRQFETSHPLDRSAGKGPFGVAEKFAFKERGGQGRTVDLHEVLFVALAGAVNMLRQMRLAGAGFAQQEHGNIQLRDDIHLVHEIAHVLPHKDEILGVHGLNIRVQGAGPPTVFLVFRRKHRPETDRHAGTEFKKKAP